VPLAVWDPLSHTVTLGGALPLPAPLPVTVPLGDALPPPPAAVAADDMDPESAAELAEALRLSLLES